MIQLRNRNEWLIPFLTQSPNTDPAALTAATIQGVWAPTATKVLSSWVAFFNGQVRSLVMMVAVAGAKGNSADIKNKYTLNNKGIDFATGPTVMTDDLVPLDVNPTPNIIVPAGTKLSVAGISGADTFRIGDILAVQFTETGTAGTATRPKMNPLGIIVRAFGNISPIHSER